MRKSLAILMLSVAVVIGILAPSCNKDDNSGINVPNSGAHDRLSTYGFYQEPMSDFIPANDRIVPYDLNSALFTDYALKQRLIYIPKGKQATYNNQEVFDFPDGSVIIKNFFYYADFRDSSSAKRILETRLLMKQGGEWNAETYVWNDEQTEATRFIAGKFIPVSWIDENGVSQSVSYQVPNKNECKGCHEYSNGLIPIGPKARHLNKDYAYLDGTTANQLDYLASKSMLAGSPGPGAAPKLPVWNDPTDGTTDNRARAYLDINCGHCHNPNGPANNSGLNLEYHVTNPAEWGVCKSPIAAGNGSGGRLYDILPGNPDGSILVYRMEVNDADIRMPELGRSIEHEDAVALIRQWITEMPGDCN